METAFSIPRHGTMDIKKGFAFSLPVLFFANPDEIILSMELNWIVFERLSRKIGGGKCFPFQRESPPLRFSRLKKIRIQQKEKLKGVGRSCRRSSLPSFH